MLALDLNHLDVIRDTTDGQYYIISIWGNTAIGNRVR